MRSLLVAAMLLACASAAAVAQTTTTTTTLPGCADAATYDSILCRLDVLAADVQAATDLGRFQPSVLGTIAKARKQAKKAADSSKSKVAKTQLKKSAHTLDSFRHKLDSNNAKQIVPAATRDALRTRASDITIDVDALRATL